MNKASFSFLFTENSIMTLPQDFDLEPSNNARQFPGTPQVITAYLEKGSRVCQFKKNTALKCQPVRIFVPKDIRPDDQLRILWTENFCGQAELLPRFTEGGED